MSDLETDAAESNRGDGSHFPSLQDQEQNDPAHATHGISFESVVTNLHQLQRQTQEQIGLLHVENDKLRQKLRKEIEEKEIWMTRCQRMDHRLAMATGDSGDQAGGNFGEKHLEVLLQENEYFKREIDKLKQQLTAFECSNNRVMNGAYDDLDHPDSGPIEDDEDPEVPSTQATADPEDSNTEHTFDTQPNQPQGIEDLNRQHTATLTRVVSQSSTDHEVAAPFQLSESQTLSDRRAAQQLAPLSVSTSNNSNHDQGHKTPDGDMLSYIAKELQHTKYKDVLRKLGLKDNKIDDIEYNHSKNPQECRFQALLHWTRSSGRNATLRKLVSTLIVSEERGLAESFCDKFELSFLVAEYDQENPEVIEPETPTLETDSPEGEEEEPEIEPEPLEKILAPLMMLPQNYADDLRLILEDNEERFTEQQLQDFVKDQKWKNESKILFRQELEVLDNNPSVFNILTCWAMVIISIYDSNPRYKTVERRKHVWRMMQSIRRSQPQIFNRFVDEKIFQGGVFGLDPDTSKKMVNQLTFNHHNRMKLKLQQVQENGHDWRGLASKLHPQIDNNYIISWSQQGNDIGAENTLRIYGTSARGTVQNLYEDLIDIERTDAARVLEEK